MNKKLLTLALSALCSLSAMAYFPNPNVFPCSASYHKDSYGKGLESAFRITSVNSNPLFVDGACFGLGKQWGLLMRSQSSDSSSCFRDFLEGFQKGFSFDVKISSTGCWQAGYDAGVANLHDSAREAQSQRVGSSCVQYYKEGLENGCNLRVPVIPSDRLLSECYVTGWNDGDQFKNITGPNGETISTGICPL